MWDECGSIVGRLWVDCGSIVGRLMIVMGSVDKTTCGELLEFLYSFKIS